MSEQVALKCLCSVLIVKGIGEGRLCLMFTYEYYCEAFPVTNQVCDFWEVLEVWQWERNDGSCSRAALGVCRQVGKFRVELHSGHFFIPALLETPPWQEMLPAQSLLGGFIICHICPAWVALPECHSAVLPSQAPLGFREMEGPDPCVCWF